MLIQQRKWMFWAVLIVALAACENLPGHKEINRDTILALATACEAYTGALRVVTPLRRNGQLTPEQIEQVNQSITITDVACADEPPADAAAALLRVTQAINVILQMQPEE